MEHGSPSLADQLATCQQWIRDLEQTTADQQAAIIQQQEAIGAYQEQLAKAAEQLRFFQRAMFGQRRDPSALTGVTFARSAKIPNGGGVESFPARQFPRSLLR
jgi:hypothetical protein